jgi:hypothetical protein
MNSKYHITTGRNRERILGHYVIPQAGSVRLEGGFGMQQAALSSGQLCRREMAQYREVSGVGGSGQWLVASG